MNAPARVPAPPAPRRKPLALAVPIGSCAAEGPAGPQSGSADEFTGCVLGSGGGFRDSSHRHDVHESTVALGDSLGIEVRTEEPSSPREAETLLEEMADPDSGCDLVVAMGPPFVRGPEAAAREHPDQDFVMVDRTSLDLPNVRTVSSDASQPGFLAGYVAASVSEAAAELTRRHLEDGADVVMPVAGRAALGTTAAVAEDDDGLFVRVDIDGWDVLPDDERTRQLTSARKGLGPAASDARTQSATSGSDKRPCTGTLSNGGVSLGECHDQTDRAGQQTADEVRAMRQQIIDGTMPTRPGQAPTPQTPAP